MVTENGVSRYPPFSGEDDIPSRRRIAHPPRLEFLRTDVPPGFASPHGIAAHPRSPRLPPPPRSPRIHPPPSPERDHFLPPPSPRIGRSGDQDRGRPPLRSPTYPTPAPDQPLKWHPRDNDGEFDRRPYRKAPPNRPGLRISNSTSGLNNRRPQGPFNDRRHNDGLALPRFPHGYSELHVDDTLRSSVNSAMTSRSSIEQASGTERSSVLTKGSSITDLSPDTPDGPHEREGGMSVEDAISMYLDGFSDVPEEPASPNPKDQHIPRPLTPVQQTDESLIDDGQTSDEHSPELKPPVDIPPVPPLPDSLPPPIPSSDVGPEESSPSPKKEQSKEETKIFIPGEVPPSFLPGKGTHDRYGFRKATHYVTIDQYESWSRQYSPFATHRKVKWSELLKENGLPTVEPMVFPPKSTKVKRYVRKGIPHEYRGAAWFWYAGGYELLNRNMGLYDELVERAMSSPSNDDKEHIERDLHRTFPDNIHFKPESTDKSPANSGSSNLKHGSAIVETQMIQSLRRVLYAFSLHNPKVGYTQSLNFITGMLLLFLTEEKAFWMLHIITSVYLPGTHEISLEGANIDLWILMVLLKECLPHLYAKIVSAGPTNARTRVPAMNVHSRLPDITLGLTNWLMSVFIGSLPLETTLRVWDVFFYEGSKTFFRVSLAIFKACERDILAVSDPMEVFQVVQTVPKRLLDANSLLEECFVRRNRVGQGRIEELRDARRIAVRQEKMRRSQALLQGQLSAATDEWPTRARTPIPGLERSIADGWRHMKQHAFR